jgi:hypothetical protein
MLRLISKRFGNSGLNFVNPEMFSNENTECLWKTSGRTNTCNGRFSATISKVGRMMSPQDLKRIAYWLLNI